MLENMCIFFLQINFTVPYGMCLLLYARGGEIAQSLASLSVKRAVRVHAQLDPLVTER